MGNHRKGNGQCTPPVSGQIINGCDLFLPAHPLCYRLCILNVLFHDYLFPLTIPAYYFPLHSILPKQILTDHS